MPGAQTASERLLEGGQHRAERQPPRAKGLQDELLLARPDQRPRQRDEVRHVTAARLRDGDAAPAVVLISTRDRTDYGPRVDRCGARGFIPKAELSGSAVAALAA